jgi:hypothetical protein
LRRAVFEGVALVTLVVVLLTGCATMEANPKTTIGAVGGGRRSRRSGGRRAIRLALTDLDFDLPRHCLLLLG